MKKTDVIKAVTQLGYDFNQYCVIMGSAMVMHELKESTNDIDIGCSSELFQQLLLQGYTFSINSIGLKKIIIENHIELFEGWLAEEVDEIDGLPVASLSDIIKMKEKLGRPKDINDINIIKSKLGIY